MADFTLIDAAIASLNAFKAAQTTSPPPATVIRVPAGTLLQPILDTHPLGATLELEANATYPGAIRISRPVTIKSAVLPSGRATYSASTWLTSADETVNILGPSIALLGVGVKSTNPDMQLVNIAKEARQTLLDQCTILGDPLKGQRRGIRPEGQGCAITRTYVDEIWRVGLETQGIGASNGCRDLLIDDCTVKGAAQAIMFGGSDADTAAGMPQNITITRSTLSKNPAWYAKKAQIKNAFELKAAANVTLTDCILEYAGNAEGQGGYLIVLTPRNQYGAATWSRVEGVTIERCVARFGGGCLSLLGTDDMFPSGPCKSVTVRNVLFDHIDPTGVWKGDGRAIFLNNGVQDLTLEHLTINGTNMGASLYAGGAPPARLMMRDVHLPPATYGIKIDGGGMGQAALQAFAPDAVLDFAPGPGAIGYPV